MRSAGTSSSSWISRVRETDQSPPLTPTYTTPRAAPKPPQEYSSKSNLTTKAFQSVFHRKQAPNNRAPSLRSAYSASSSSSENYPPNPPSHPYSTMNLAPLPVVSNHDATEDEEECPVCLEPLSFSFRLPGEKPHIVPECGHALHEVSRSCPPLINAFWLTISSTPRQGLLHCCLWSSTKSSALCCSSQNKFGGMWCLQTSYESGRWRRWKVQ